MSDQSRELSMVSKFLGLVELMRKHQAAFFRTRMEYDKRQSIKYEKQVDDYMKILKKAGLEPTYNETNQGGMF
jgi:hypothetical protein